MSRGETTRERVIDEACRLMWTKGVGATSVGELLSASGTTKGGFYHHFSTKEELGLAVIERFRTDFIGFLDQTLVGTTPGERLGSFLTAALDLHRKLHFVGG